MSECKYCKKESYERPFCPECAKKYFGFSEEIKPPKQEIKDEYIEKNEDNKKEERAQTDIFVNNFSFDDNLSFEDDFSSNFDTEDLEEYKELPNFLSEDIRNNFKDEENYTYCLNCGDDSNGYRYCKKCYYELINYKPQKYKNLSYDTYNHKHYNYNSMYITKQGQIVRSKSEVIIGNFLERHKIGYKYEKEFKCKNGKIIHPDFYIKGPYKLGFRKIKDIYIEHWGLIDIKDKRTNVKYREDMIKKIEQYKNAGITLICTYEQDLNKYYFQWFQYKLFKKLISYKDKTINFERES